MTDEEKYNEAYAKGYADGHAAGIEEDRERAAVRLREYGINEYVIRALIREENLFDTEDTHSKEYYSKLNYLAMQYEWALHDEASRIFSAEEIGEERGIRKGIEKGRKEGILVGREEGRIGRGSDEARECSKHADGK